MKKKINVFLVIFCFIFLTGLIIYAATTITSTRGSLEVTSKEINIDVN